MFVSHSRKDKELVYEVAKLLYRSGVEPFIAEFEELEGRRFTSEEIKREITNSQMLALLLTPNVTLTLHTISWVICEVGVAHALNKAIQLYENENNPVKDLPIPHIDIYWLFDFKSMGDWI